MKATTAYRRISSWTDEQCHPFKKDLWLDGIDGRAIFMAAAASLSGKLAAAQTDGELYDCIIAYELMARSKKTSASELNGEMEVLLDDLNAFMHPQHALN